MGVFPSPLVIFSKLTKCRKLTTISHQCSKEKNGAGKRAFGKAREGFNEMMKKGFNGKVNDTCFKVLDNRKNGAEINIEIEVTDNENRGIAVLKLYGPNKRKGNVVMVTKSKRSDAKFVTILAKNVVLPLIKQFLTGEKDDERPPGPLGLFGVRKSKY